MLAFLALMPMRLRAFAGLEIGRSILPDSKLGFRVVLDPASMKTSTWWESPLPELLVELVTDYLAHVRPILQSRSSLTCGSLWLNDSGRPYRAAHLSERISALTDQHIGVSVSPQLFRDCAATTLTLASPDSARLTRAILGHSNFRTAERHYVHASGVDAGRTLSALVDDIAGKHTRDSFDGGRRTIVAERSGAGRDLKQEPAATDGSPPVDE